VTGFSNSEEAAVGLTEAVPFLVEDMLKQMAGMGGPRDALTRFTTPLTGAYYFCPSVNALAEFVTAKDDDD